MKQAFAGAVRMVDVIAPNDEPFVGSARIRGNRDVARFVNLGVLDRHEVRVH